MNKKYIVCPVCGKHQFPIWEDNGTCVCPCCGWAHDAQSEENALEVCGPNDLSLENSRLRYQYYVERNPSYHWARDGYPAIEQIEPMICPVCGKFKFEKLTWDDLYCGVTPSDVWCRDCGWHYDLKQSESPELQEGANALSLNAYKLWYAAKIEENPQYSFFEETTSDYSPEPHECPVCGKYTFEDTCSSDICPFCGWEDDGTEDDTEILGANDLRFSLYKERYHRYIAHNPEYRWNKNGKP